jgi:tetratricopeptide (TPR) repeat protein
MRTQGLCNYTEDKNTHSDNTLIFVLKQLKNIINTMLNFKIILRFIGITILVTMMTLPTYAQRKKKEEEQTKAKKAYNDLTHKYNAYFNANLLMDKVVDGLTEQHQENYNQILPMYRHLAIENSAASSSDLDIIIKKSGVAISLHRMSHWTDDSYLLIGQSEFLKGELQQAEGTFRYVISELDPEKLKEELEKKKGKKKKKGGKKKGKKKKKKKDEGLKRVVRPRDKYGNIIEPKEEDKPKTEKEIIEEIPTNDEAEKYFLKHRPAHKEAILWLARTQIAQEKYDEAFIVLNRLRRDKGLTQEIRAEVEAAEAYAYLQQKEYERAIEPLTKAAVLSKDRQQKMRYTYILAQLHQRAGRGNEAYATYEKVLKLRPLYEMEFNTRLSIAKNSYENGDASIDDAIRDLEKMLKDEKNEEYLDQIYFAMAEIELKRENRPLAIQYLQKSVYNNINNQPQKAEAYYLLAELYYGDEVYTNAKYYYDSTLVTMVKSDERQPTVKSRSVMLKEIAANIEIIELQDSLIRIMNMSDEERMALAIQIREAELKAKKEAAKGKNTKGRRPTAIAQPTALSARNGTNNIGTWWAYDVDAVRKGKRDFEREWGQRRLSDDWRRSNRKNADIGIDEVEGKEGKYAALTTTEVDEIFKKMGVPQGNTDLAKANNKISEAMAALGPLYRDRLKNNPRAIDILEQLMTRYPENKYKMESAYLLYLMYTEKPDFVKANRYKDLILKTDAKSKFAKAITDPKFLEKEKDKQIRIQDYYNNAYGLFEKGDTEAALVKVDEVDKTFEPKTNPLRPKFALLGAMCEGNLKGKEAYKIALNDVVKTYPETDEAKRAAEILRILGSGDATASNKTKPANSMFSEEDGTHFFIATYSPDVMSRNDITTKFTDYNRKYHSLKRLRVNSIYLDLKTPVLVVKRFKSKAEAMEYYDAVSAGTINQFIDGGLEENKIIPMVVSQDNYKTIVRKKAIQEYLEFFEAYYK